MFKRALALPEPGTETFFLWGPRQTGKSTLLRGKYGDGRWVDLLKADEFRRYVSRPELLRQELEEENPGPAGQVVIDEIQKVPALLDEVHWLIENRGVHFALCGSSARKVKRGAANLLGGRAMRYELHGLSAHEIGRDFDLNRMLNHGYLPRIYQASRPARMLDAYIADYLKEEIAAEGLVRDLPTFSNFLDVAALSDGEIVNFSNIARECAVSSHTTKSHFQILEDTLLGRWLPAYRKRAKRRVIGSPKFYFVDVGVVNRLARRGELLAGSELYGKAFENWVFHELSSFISYREVDRPLSYWRVASGIEVDFVVGNMLVAIEAKSGVRITRDHLKGLRSLVEDHPGVKRRIVVCRERHARDGRTTASRSSPPRRLFVVSGTGISSEHPDPSSRRAHQFSEPYCPLFRSTEFLRTRPAKVNAWSVLLGSDVSTTYLCLPRANPRFVLEASMLGNRSRPKIPLPKQWTRRVRSGVLHAISLAHYSLTYTRSWAANSINARIRLKADNDRLRQELVLLQEEMRIKDSRMLRIPAQRRPHYLPTERLAILELRAARSWSLSQTARHLLVTTATVSSWVGRLNEEGPQALVQTRDPVNRFPDFVIYIVRRLNNSNNAPLDIAADRVWALVFTIRMQ